MPKVASQELVKLIQSLPRYEGYIYIAKETYYKEDDNQLLDFLNAMYNNKNEIITYELLKTISVTESQKNEFIDIMDDIDQKIAKMERRMERRDRR